MSKFKENIRTRLRRKKIVLFTNFQAGYYGSSSGGGRKSSVYSWSNNKFIDFLVSWVGTGLKKSRKLVQSFSMGPAYFTMENVSPAAGTTEVTSDFVLERVQIWIWGVLKSYFWNPTVTPSSSHLAPRGVSQGRKMPEVFNLSHLRTSTQMQKVHVDFPPTPSSTSPLPPPTEKILHNFIT